jgi:uncharacterized protein
MKMSVAANIHELLPRLRDYFQNRTDIDMAFLFGSVAQGRGGVDSDIDMAIHFRVKNAVAEMEERLYFTGEEEIWSDMEKITGREIDLIVLNRAPATVSDSALRGIPIVIKDRGSHLSFLLRVTSEAIDFREWVEHYWRIKEDIRNVHSSRV